MVSYSSQPLVSVVVPNFNGARHIIECLTSIAKQTYSNFEILVVDDGSIDESVEIITLFIRNFPQIKTKLICQTNAGVSVARNKGFNHSNGQYVAFLDSDDYWFPNMLEEKILEISRTKSKVCGSLMRYGNTNSRLFGICGEDPLERQNEIQLGKLMPFVLSSITFESELIEKLSGFDTELRYSQDLDLLARCAQITEISILRKPLGVYRLHGFSISSTHGLLQEKNYQYIKFKYQNFPTEIKNISFLEYMNSQSEDVSNDRRAAIHFRNFGVRIMNGDIVIAVIQLVKAVSISPKYVFGRIFLRFRLWASWKIRES